jgi:hypothetical protein
VIHKIKVCGCGHEETRHPNRGACEVCQTNGLGLPPCPRFHSRRHGDPAPVPVLAAPSLSLTDALLELERACQRVRAALPKVPFEEAVSFEAPKPKLYGTWKPGRCARELLHVLGRRAPKPTTSAQLAVMSGYSFRSSGFSNTISALRTQGMIDGDRDALRITADGARLAPTQPLPRGSDLLDLWKPKLGRCERSLLHVLCQAFPDPLTKAQLAELTGYSVDSSGLSNAISKLRTLELAEGRSEIRASEALQP